MDPVEKLIQQKTKINRYSCHNKKMEKTGICVVCATPFSYVRGSKKTCSTKCRKANSRESKNTNIAQAILMDKPNATIPNKAQKVTPGNNDKTLEDLLWKLAYLQAERINSAYHLYSMHQSELDNLVQHSNTLLQFIETNNPSFFRSRLVIQVLKVAKKIKYLHLPTDQDGWFDMLQVPRNILQPCFEALKIEGAV